MGDSSVEVTEESQPNARVGTQFTGVRRQASGRYTAQAKDERGEDKHLGTFDTAAEAVEVRKDFVLNLELKEQLKKKKKKKKEKACIALEKRVVSAQENSSAAEESIAESPEEEKRPLQEGDRVKYVGQSRTLSNGQHGRIHKINGDQVAVLFDPTLCLLDTSDILHDNDNEAEDSYIAMQAFFEEKYMHRVQELEKKHMHEVQELEKKHMHEVQELEKKCTHEVQELNKELLLQNDAAATKEECFRAERLEMFLEAKNLRNTIINLTGQIRIFCRVRPLKKDETKCILDFDGAPKGDIGIMCGTKRVFKFDRVYTPNDDQAKVYSDVSPLVTSVMDGCNVCIFAYGQTGTGKTFTMEGTERDRGVNYRTLEELFKIAEEREDITYNISVVVLEIYNEEIRDLLATSSSSKKLEVRETCEGTHYVPGVAEVTVKDLNEVWGVLQSSNNSRAVASNNVNEHSSRSHCALCVVVRATNLINGDFSKSKLWLVDLAGTERLTNTNAEGDRRNEAININNSLTCLGNVISSLVKREKHIPYRESNLTKLLQDSIGGDAKTLMILQLSPSENDASQTLTTLNYAQRARSWPAKKDVMMSKAKTARPPLQDVMMSKAKTARPPLQDVMMSKAKTVRPPPAGSRAKLQQQTSTPPAGSRVKLQQQTSTPPAGSRVKLQQQTPKTVRNFRM